MGTLDVLFGLSKLRPRVGGLAAADLFKSVNIPKGVSVPDARHKGMENLVTDLLKGSRYENSDIKALAQRNDLTDPLERGYNSSVFTVTPQGTDSPEQVVKIPASWDNVVANQRDLSNLKSLITPSYMHPKGYISAEPFLPYSDEVARRLSDLRGSVTPELKKTLRPPSLDSNPVIRDAFERHGLGDIVQHNAEGNPVFLGDLMRDANYRMQDGQLKLIDRGALQSPEQQQFSDKDLYNWLRYLKDAGATPEGSGAAMGQYQFMDPTSTGYQPKLFRRGGLAALNG